jgi:hypothetical protein
MPFSRHRCISLAEDFNGLFEDPGQISRFRMGVSLVTVITVINVVQQI